MLTQVLTYLNNTCPKCGQVLVCNHAKQLAQCAKCHPHGQNPTALLMQSGMNFLQAEAWINSNRHTAERQSAQGSLTLVHSHGVRV